MKQLVMHFPDPKDLSKYTPNKDNDNSKPGIYVTWYRHELPFMIVHQHPNGEKHSLKFSIQKELVQSTYLRTILVDDDDYVCLSSTFNNTGLCSSSSVTYKPKSMNDIGFMLTDPEDNLQLWNLVNETRKAVLPYNVIATDEKHYVNMNDLGVDALFNLGVEYNKIISTQFPIDYLKELKVKAQQCHDIITVDGVLYNRR